MKELDPRPFENYVKDRLGAERFSYEDLHLDVEQINSEHLGKRKVKKERLMKVKIRPIRSAKWKVGMGVGVATLCLGAFSLLLIPFLQLQTRWNDWSVSRHKASYDPAYIEALNMVQHPKGNPDTIASKYPLSEEYVATFNEFAYRIFEGMEEKAESSLLYSPYSFYRLLDLASLLTDSPLAEELFSSTLGDATLREQNRNTAYYGLNWESSYGEDCFEVRDALFLEKACAPYRNEVIEQFSKAYVEAFGVDLQSQKGWEAILSWARGNSIDSDLLSMDDFMPEIQNDDPTRLMLMNIMNANIEWRSSFDRKENLVAPFHLLGGEKKDVTYLNHHLFNARVYDYGDYVSAYDAYKHGYTIQYLVPKSVDDSIFALLEAEGRNFLIEDETKRLEPSADSYDGLMLDLSVPKFTMTTHVDFRKTMTALGLQSFLTGAGCSFDKAFAQPSEPIYLNSPKQVNRISFTEDGTSVTTVAFVGGCGAAAPMTGDEIRVELNQPFVYVIRDMRGLPLYVGSNLTGN